MNVRAAIIFILVFACHLAAIAQHTSTLGRFNVDAVSGCAPFTVNVTINSPFVCDASQSCDMDFEGDGTFRSLTFTYTYNQPGNFNLRILFQTTGWDSIPIEVSPNIPPEFDLYSCATNEVSVQIRDSNYDEYVVDYNDGSAEVVLPGTGIDQHQYPASAMQTVTVRGRNSNGEDNCIPAGRIITPLSALPRPTITLLEVLDDQSIRLEFDAQPNIQYRLGIATNNGTTFQQLKTIYNQTVDTISDLRTDDNYYCFQLAAYDPCNNAVIPSATICSPNLDLTVRNNVIDVAWAMSTTGVQDYRLTRTASDGTLLLTMPNGSPYPDAGVDCGIEYCYELVVNYTNGSRSISSSQCGIGFSTDIPTAINNITAMVNDNSVVLEWQTDPAFNPAAFTLEKSTGGGGYVSLATTAQSAYADDEYDPAQATCYRISYTDVCGNESPTSAEACPIRLTGNLQNDNAVTLSWTPYEGWADGVSSYVIEKFSEDGVLLQTIPVGTATTYTDAGGDLTYQLYIYLINAVPADPSLGQASSNRVTILKDPNIFHPTAFTPNGDNLNDIFTVFGQYVVAFEMKIFNRWGELLFTTDDIQGGWDGTFRGVDMPEGTYSFIAHITDRAGRTFKRSGSMLLLRRE